MNTPPHFILSDTTERLMARQGPIFRGRTGLGRASRTLAFTVGVEYGPHPFPWPSRTPRAGHAPVAQLDRASDYGSEGWEFESLRARHIFNGLYDFWASVSTYGKQAGSNEKKHKVRPALNPLSNDPFS